MWPMLEGIDMIPAIHEVTVYEDVNNVIASFMSIHLWYGLDIAFSLLSHAWAEIEGEMIEASPIVNSTALL